jgi:hypothetical protein
MAGSSPGPRLRQKLPRLDAADARPIWPYNGAMNFAGICLTASFLVVVVIVAKMLRAIRLLDGRVTVLQEQLSYGRAGKKPAGEPPRPVGARTPVAGVPVVAAVRRTPARDEPADESPASDDDGAVVIEQAEVDAVWARLEAEQERLRQAMGRDFQGRTRKRSAGDVRGRPVVRAMSSQEIARKLERK